MIYTMFSFLHRHLLHTTLKYHQEPRVFIKCFLSLLLFFMSPIDLYIMNLQGPWILDKTIFSVLHSRLSLSTQTMLNSVSVFTTFHITFLGKAVELKGTICKISVIKYPKKLLAQCGIFHAVYLCYPKSSQGFVNPEKFQF